MTTKKQPNSSTPSAKEKAAARGTKIKDVRLKMPLVKGKRMTGDMFGRLFGVKNPRISAWEKGEKPPTEALLKLAELAPDGATKSYFLSEAGVTEQSALFSEARAVFLRQRECESDPQDVILLPVRASVEAASENYAHKIVVPLTRIPNPESTFCIEVGRDSARGPYAVASLVINDGSRREILGADEVLDGTAKAPELAVFFDELPHRELVASRAALEVSPPHEVMRVYLTASHRETPDEPLQGPGVRFGTVHLRVIPTDEGRLWAFTLSSDGRQEVLLTNWKDGALPPTDEAAHSMLRKGTHVLGTVIGWFAPIRAARPDKKGADGES